MAHTTDGLGIAPLADRLDHQLAAADAALTGDYPGDRGTRQPVHTVYVPADRYTATTVSDWGRTALAALDATSATSATSTSTPSTRASSRPCSPSFHRATPTPCSRTYDMAVAVSEKHPQIDEVRFSCPNKHHFFSDLSFCGLENPGEV